MKDETTGEYVSKVWEQGKKTLGKLKEVKDEYGLDNAYKIKRTGSGKDDTEYTILHKGELKGDQLKAVCAVELRPLTKGGEAPVNPAPSDEDLPELEDGVPF